MTERVNPDADILSMIRAAFVSCTRPAHFTDHKHCKECLEHNELLRARNLETLTIADVGNLGWTPIPFTTAGAFCYLFPALARLSLDEPDDFYGWYFPELLFFLTLRDLENEHLRHFTAEQRHAVVAFLRYASVTRRQLIIAFRCKADLTKAINLWTQNVGGGPNPATGARKLRSDRQ